MSTIAKKSLLLATMLGLSAAAFAQSVAMPLKEGDVIPYMIDQRGVVAKSNFGLCWRTSYWTPAAAENVMYGQYPIGCECDKDLMPKAKCEPAAPVAAAPAKPAAPAPAPAAAPKPAAQKVTLAADALFDFNKAVLRPEGKAKLDKLANDIKGIKLEVIIAVGHADRFGSDAYNQKLSEKRAEAVKAYLVSKGVEPNRVYTEGKGEKQPVTKPDQCKGPKSKKVVDCLQPDRRVEIEVIGTK
jgi:OOP family OmpA-OmpF porin